MANCRNCGTEIEQYLYDRYEGLCFTCFDREKGKPARKIKIIPIIIGLGIIGLILIILGILLVLGSMTGDDPLGLTLMIIGVITLAISIFYFTRNTVCCRCAETVGDICDCFSFK